MTLNVAMEKYWNEHGQYCHSAWSSIDPLMKNLINYFGTRLCLHEIHDPEINGYVATEKSAQHPVTDSTINRRLSLLRSVMNRARRKWGVEVSSVDIGKHLLREPEARTRWLTPQEADKLILAAAQHLKAPIRCALLTGLRLNNIVDLRWEQVDLDSRIIITRVKSRLLNRKTHEIPISDALYELLLEQGIRDSGHVFLRHFKKEGLPSVPVKKFRFSFRNACNKAGIKDFRFHDLRHTAASWMVQNNVPLDVVKDVLGHSDISMTMKYAHRQNSSKAEALEKLATSHIRHTAKKGKRYAS